MKKAAHILPFLLFSIYLAIPAVSLVNLATGYSIWIYSYHAYALLTAAISLAVAVNSFFVKDAALTKTEALCILFMPLMPLINWICYIIPAGWKFTALCMPVLFYMCFSLYVTKYKASKEESNSIFILYNIFYSYMFYFAS